MRKYLVVLLIALSTILSSCLTFSTVNYQIEFNEDLSSGFVKISYINIQSTEADTAKQKKDFNELIELLFGDDFLLDNIDEGIYIKDRKLYEKNEQLIAEYSGIFRSSKLGADDMKITENERILRFDKDDGDIATSNGKILETNDSFIFTWPKEMRKSQFTIKRKTETAYSMLDFFNEWKNK